MSGNKVGTAIFKREADGKFTASSDLAIGSIKLGSKVSGQFEGESIKELSLVADQAGKQVTLTLKDKKISFRGTTVDYDPKGKLLIGNLIPQFSKSVLKAVDFKKKSAQKFKALMPDSGNEIEVTITPSDLVSYRGKEVRSFKVALGGVETKYYATPESDVVGVDVPSQNLKFVDPSYATIFRDPFAEFPGLSKPTFETQPPKVEKMKTRDGVTLVQDVYLPKGEGKFPTILMRTPYGRSSAAAMVGLYVKRGYAVVSQDCRGRDDSEGKFDPMVNERKDGYDTVAWIAKQPWSDGNVGMIGGSYGGYVQWAAAVENHPALKCIVPQVSPPDAMRNLPYEYGVFTLFQNLWWGKIVADKKADMSTFRSAPGDVKKLTELPLGDLDKKVLGKTIPFWKAWLTRTTDKDWKGWDHTKDITKVRIPVFHISGWWDGDQIGTKLHWEALRKAKKQNQWLIYGPWTHAFNTTHKTGDVEYGEQAILDLDPLYVQFFDTYLKKMSVGWEKTPKVKAFITGANKWVSLKDWPDDSVSKPMSYFLSKPKPRKDGLDFGDLVQSAPGSQPSTTYTYEPKKEVVPMAMIEMDESKSSMRIDFKASDHGAVFRTAPMTKSTTITGPIDLDLYVKSNRQDTDLFAALVDWDEKGVARLIAQWGKLRASYRFGTDRQVPLTPGKVEKVTLHIWDVAHEVKPGHRLGVLIQSSLFPLSSRNSGTLESILTSTKLLSQTNSIEHSKVYPSALRFRVLN